MKFGVMKISKDNLMKNPHEAIQDNRLTKKYGSLIAKLLYEVLCYVRF